MLKIGVTGAGGFIGSHLVSSLLNAGYYVKALVEYTSNGDYGWLDCEEKHPHLEIVLGDVRDPFFVESFVDGCDIVYHLAALIAIPYSYSAPRAYIDTNIIGTQNLAQASIKYGVKKFIHTSTSEVYGSAQYTPIDESHPVVGQSPYSASKIAADHVVFSYVKSFGLPAVTIRPFNTYGPRQSARAVIPTIITQALTQRQIKLGDLSPRRDFNYVTDTVSGFISVLGVDIASVMGQVINIGSGFDFTIGEIVELVSDILNLDISLEFDAQRVRPPLSEVNRLLACNKKANEMLGWSPKYAGINGIRRGLEETISWFSERDNLRKYKVNVYNV